MKKKFLTFLFVTVFAAVCAVALTACSNGGESAPGGSSSGDKAEESIVAVNRKIYYTVYLDLVGEEPEKIGSAVRAETTAKGGYVESSSETFSDGDSAYYRYTVRIPTGKLNEFLAAIEGQGKVGSKRIDTVDVTTGYVNTQARKEALESEKEVLDSLMHKDGVTVADVLTISNRIAEINAELNALEIRLNEYDSLIDYSTVNVYISKPKKVSVAVFVVPVVLLVAIAGTIVGVIVAIKKKKARNTEPQRHC